MRYPEAVQIAFNAFRDYHDIRVVGGCVRDILVNRTPKDWDMCTPAKPRETMDILRKVGLRPYDMSNGHGTICFEFEGDTIEITTLRIDKKTDGRHAEVEFTDDFVLDAARRDFTINAMSMDEKMRLYDYFGGQGDLINQRVKFVGDADARIKEDYLRILRYYRFVGRFGQVNKIHEDYNTSLAIYNNVKGLEQISGERVWMEMQQIFALESSHLLFTMQRNGIIKTLGIKLKDGI